VSNAWKSKDNLCLGSEDEDVTQDEMAKEMEQSGEDTIPKQNAGTRGP